MKKRAIFLLLVSGYVVDVMVGMCDTWTPSREHTRRPCMIASKDTPSNPANFTILRCKAGVAIADNMKSHEFWSDCSHSKCFFSQSSAE